MYFIPYTLHHVRQYGSEEANHHPNPTVHLSQLLLHKRRTQILRRRIARVLKVLRIDALAVRRIADAVAKDAHIERLGDPGAGDAGAESAREAVDVARRRAAIVVDVAGQSRLVCRVADQEDALDGGELGACELRHGVDGRLGALRVALEDEALVGAGGEGAGDLVDYVRGAGCRVLGEVGGVDGVVDLAAAESGCDARVHGSEAGRWALSLTRTARVDDRVGGAGGRGSAFYLLHGSGKGACEEGKYGEKGGGVHCG